MGYVIPSIGQLYLRLKYQSGVQSDVEVFLFLNIQRAGVNMICMTKLQHHPFKLLIFKIIILQY